MPCSLHASSTEHKFWDVSNKDGSPSIEYHERRSTEAEILAIYTTQVWESAQFHCRTFSVWFRPNACSAITTTSLPHRCCAALAAQQAGASAQQQQHHQNLPLREAGARHAFAGPQVARMLFPQSVVSGHPGFCTPASQGASMLQQSARNPSRLEERHTRLSGSGGAATDAQRPLPRASGGHHLGPAVQAALAVQGPGPLHGACALRQTGHRSLTISLARR